MEKVEARATLERARTLGTTAVEAVKGQRGDRYTVYACAPMMEGGDECILSREKPGIRNIRLGRNKGMGICLASPRRRRLDDPESKVVVNVPLQSITRWW